MKNFELVMVAHACNVFKASLVCIVRPCIKGTKQSTNQSQNKKAPYCVGLLLQLQQHSKVWRVYTECRFSSHSLGKAKVLADSMSKDSSSSSWMAPSCCVFMWQEGQRGEQGQQASSSPFGKAQISTLSWFDHTTKLYSLKLLYWKLSFSTWTWRWYIQTRA